ncbi:YeiH family protein [Vibrio olivae]|uniref:YeiH family protein n=1 Tax=Vibrio olivae TaxID=1243002 RepID=A0ABV5HKH4_9VIBR
MANNIKFIPFLLALAYCLTPYASSPSALLIGFLLSVTQQVPARIPVAAITKKLLSYSIIGLGFGVPLQQALTVTTDSIGLILISITGTLILGYFMSQWLKLESRTGYLISAGTAICGGSAIAAVAPAINAKDDQMGLALATVFILNSVALFVFPVIGHALGMSQLEFGTWAAVAIHDTSSVVGAASAYGEQALTTATTLKLTRALWIIPVALISAVLFRSHGKKWVLPYFIAFYALAIIVSDQWPQFSTLYQSIFSVSKRALIICLFLIGCGISVEKMRGAGVKPLVLGVGLWVSVSLSSLAWIMLS